MSGLVQFSTIDDISVIRINNPPVNALSQSVRAGIQSALKQSSDLRARAVLILCSGRTFIAGADIKEFGKPPAEPVLPKVIAALENYPAPVIAALHGNALGGGLEVAMAAHYRIALADAKLGLPEVKLGLLPGAGGTQRLPRLVGVERALKMMTSGAPISAQSGLELGLVDKTVEADLEEAAIDYCRALVADCAGPRPTGLRSLETPAKDYFENYRKATARKTRGQLAPGHIIDLVEIATHTDIKTGQELERTRFLECLASPQSAAMRYVFNAERTAVKVPDIPVQTPVMPVERVAIIGAGTMGGGIAMSFANAGIPVVLVETEERFLQKGLDNIRTNYATSVKRGRFTKEAVDQALSFISVTTDYTDIADVDLAIEAVFENMEVKKQVFSQLDKVCKASCILATNTSYLDVNEIAATTSRPGKVIGAHFFSPANVMKLLEVVRGARTEPATLKTVMSLAKMIDKTPVAVGVCNGFVGNRMLKGYARQAQLLLLEGASPQQVDAAMESWGMAMGPLAVGDLAGIDIGYRSRRDQGIEPHSVKEYALADTLAEMDRLGQKKGAGYYLYTSEKRQRTPDPEVDALIEEIADHWKVERRSIDDEEIVNRLILALVNEGAKILEEGIAMRASDIDTVYINGYGFPAWRGGPMFYADQLGLDKVVERLNALHAQTTDEGWRPAPLLIKLAETGEMFASR